MTKVTQATYDETFTHLLALFEEMIEDAETTTPEKWDDEYAQHAINEVIDRLICAGPRRPSEPLRERYHELYDRARPYLLEDVELPATPDDYERGAASLRELVRLSLMRRPADLRARQEWRTEMEKQAESINCTKTPVLLAVVASFSGMETASLSEGSLSVRVDDEGVAVIEVNVKLRPQTEKVLFAATVDPPR